MYGRDDPGELLAARKPENEIKDILSGKTDPMKPKRPKRREKKRSNRYAIIAEEEREEGAKSLSVDGRANGGGGDGWDEFMSLVAVLQQYGFVDDNYAVTTFVEIGAKVRSENELWTSIVLLEPDLEGVSPVHLGAILGATQMEAGSSWGGEKFVECEVSP